MNEKTRAFPQRTIAEWKSAMLTLPDGPFFDLMRTYLGDIRTPFNKQRLIDELAGFLGRKEIQDTVLSFLDATDKRMIAAIECLEEPAADELSEFFEGELSFAELHAVLLNLEERLILFKFDDEGRRRLALNPALKAVLDPFASDISILFPSFPLPVAPELPALGSPSGESAQALDDLFIAAVIAFLYRRSDLYKVTGEYRKKASDDMALVFPPDSFTVSAGVLRALGVVANEGEKTRVDQARLEALASLDSADRAFYIAAGACGGELGGGQRVPRERLAAWARMFHELQVLLDPGRLYPSTTILKLLTIAEHASRPHRRRRWGPDDRKHDLFSGADPALFRAACLRALIIAGILQETAPMADPDRRTDVAVTGITDSEGSDIPVPDTSAQTKLYRLRAGTSGPAAPSSPDRPALVLDSAFGVTVSPEISFLDALELGRFLDLRETGRVIRFELTRESAVRGFNGGITPETMLKTIDTLSGRDIPQNIRWSISDWHTRYSSVGIYHGIVLTVAQERRFILETEPLAGMIERELAPGVYLLKIDSEEEAARALVKAGVDIIAFPGKKEARDPQKLLEEDEHHFTFYAPVSQTTPRTETLAPLLVLPQTPPVASMAAGTPNGSPSNATAGGSSGTPTPTAGSASAAERLEALRSALAAKPLPKDQRDELAARLERRVVLAPTQLVGAAVRYEKLEAKGLDYVGKVRVAEQAIAIGSFVEMFWRGPKGEPNRALGAPIALEKNGGEVELVVDPAPRGERIKVAVGKISLIRRIKRSIFGD